MKFYFSFFFQDEAVYKKSSFRKNDPTIESQIFYSEGVSRTAATSKIERFVIIVNGWKPLTIITKRSILDVAAVLDPPLTSALYFYYIFLWLEESLTYETLTGKKETKTRKKEIFVWFNNIDKMREVPAKITHLRRPVMF